MQQMTASYYPHQKLRESMQSVRDKKNLEVLSPDNENERRDRELKLKLYSERGVQEYWIIDWQRQQVEIFRREQWLLQLIDTLLPPDQITSPLLPGFSYLVSQLFQ